MSKTFSFRKVYSLFVAGILVWILMFFQTTQLQAQPELFDLGITIDPDAPYRDSQGRAIQQTRDGGFVNISHAWLSIGAQFTKTDMFGNVQQQMYYWEDPGLDPWSIHQTNADDEGYVFVGSNSNNRRAVMIKINDDGTLNWYKRMGTLGISEARCVEVLANGNYVMVGFEENASNAGLTHILLICYSPGGVLQWSRRVNVSAFQDCSLADLRAFSIRQTGNKQLLITGSANLDCPGQLGQQGVILLRFHMPGGTAAPVLISSHLYQTENFATVGMDVRETCDGGYLISGIAYDLANPPRTDGLVISADQNGTLKWSKIIGDLSHDEEFYAIEETPEAGGAMVVGRFKHANGQQTRILGMRFNGAGHTTWTMRLEAPDWTATSQQGAFDMERTVEGTYAISGYKNNIGQMPTDEHTYVLHIDDQLCANETLCYFKPANNITVQGSLAHSLLDRITTYDGPDTTFFYFDTTHYSWQSTNECPRSKISSESFQYHYNDHIDRGFGGVAFEKTLGSSGPVVNQYALTGVCGDGPNLATSKMPIVVHEADGSIVDEAIVEFRKSASENYGAEGHDIQRTSSDGFVIAGRLINSLGGSNREDNAIIVKTDDQGVPSWSKSVGQRLAGYNELFREIRPIPIGAAPDGNGYVAAGYATNNGSQRQALVTHINRYGTLQFAKTYAVQQRQYTEAHSVQPVDSDGDGVTNDGFIVAGTSKDLAGNPGNNGFADRDVFVMRLDDSGNIQWAKSYSVGDCLATSVVPTDDDSDGANDDGFILCGMVKDGDEFSALALKLDANGTVDWAGKYDRSENDRAMAIVQRADGSFAFTGVTHYEDVANGQNYGDQVYLVQLNSSGNVNMSQAAPGPEFHVGMIASANEDCANDLDVLNDGSLLISGSNCTYSDYAKGDIYSIKTACENDCRMQPLNDEAVVTPSVQTFTHVIAACGSGATVCSTDVNNSNWIHTEQAFNDAIEFEDNVICNSGELCEPPLLLVTSAPDQIPSRTDALKLSPNPVRVNSLVTVKCDAGIIEGSMFQIHDVSGRKVLELPAIASQEEHVLPIGDWPGGMYVLTIIAPDGPHGSVKFIVQ